MTYDEAMQFWLGRVNYEQRTPLPGDLKLDRMRALLQLLDNPHERLRIVHIAGSKGKGSTSAMLAAILYQAGYRTGLFTSPNLVQVEERFQVDRQPISPAELAALLTEIQTACRCVPWDGNQNLEPALTFFEIATAVGFLHFVRRHVQFAVLEVGLGGRFDSTNVCNPLLSIITSISFDHTQQLGNTLALIAAEKAGIIKPGRPVVNGARESEARDIIQDIARQRGAPLRQLDRDFHYRHEPACIGQNGDRITQVQITTWKNTWPRMEIGLVGEHQAANAALAVAAVEELRDQGIHISDQAVAEGLAKVNWPARLEVVGRHPLVLLDCAHNVASAQALVQALQASFPLAENGRRFLVFAGSRDKDIQGMLAVLAPHFEHIYLTQSHNSSRRISPERAAELLPSPQPNFTLCPHAADAWQQARNAAHLNDLICITGSVFLAGELRPIICQ